ncbi:MAG TPA: phenylalanine--tRNA ligase subunit alpha [Candidatus Omnitrophica bacterium]|nr:phenylalanine--tRNA ligase subunit alpha [Candidatus Omnitrophota bacterium]
MSVSDISNIAKAAETDINSSADFAGLEFIRVKYLGRQGIVAGLFTDMRNLSQEERPGFGKKLNELKNSLTSLIKEKQASFKKASVIDNAFDPTLPGVAADTGSLHILTQTIEEICEIFAKMGFSVIEGPEVETEYNNFTGLNIPLEHPSRDAFDTFYLKGKNGQQKSDGKLLLRSHTSPVQVRLMKSVKPPVAAVVPGKVYRPDATDASHSFMFHQVEGFLVDENIRFSDLKGVLDLFLHNLFGGEVKTRFRPHFFPFTEPSAEVDVSCIICKGKGCSTCGRKGWLEILGSGMIHPNVFKHVGYDPKKCTGFAFGMGVERIAMLKYGISDIRMFFENDLRFLKQF